MAVGMMSLKKYVFSSAKDMETPKTEFHMKPLGVEDYMPVFAAFQMIAPSGAIGQSKEVAEAILSESGRTAMLVIREYLQNHIIEVKNIRDDDGNLRAGPGTEYWDKIDIFTSIEIVADAIIRSQTPPETEKNLE